MLPIKWSQPPCMNIDVTGVYHDGMSLKMQTALSLTGTRAPGGCRLQQLAGNQPQAAYRAREHRLAAETLQQRPSEHIRGDEPVGDDRRQEVRIVIAERKHRASLHAGAARSNGRPGARFRFAGPTMTRP